MSIFTQLLDLPNLQFEQVSLDEDQIEIRAMTTCSAAPCPSCGARSPRVHSHYQRILQDLPWGRRRLRIILHLRRFRCQPAACGRQTFVERLPQIAPPYARVTTRLRNRQQLIACAVTGELGARLTPRLGIPCSADALLRLVRQAPIPPPPPPRIIGIDDWAKRKGRDYGTLIIDLERRQPIDVLPERTADAVAAWLQQHPTVEMVSRDRADAYIEGVTRGAPDAVQIADRWHLVKNLGDALQRMLERHGPQLRAAATPERAAPEPPPAAPAAHTGAEMGRPIPNPQAKPQHQARFAEVKQLRAQGWSISRVARQVGLNRRTVRKYDQVDQVPVRILPQNLSDTLPFLPTIQVFVQQGNLSCQQIWARLHAQGFQGSYSSVRRFLKQLGWQPPSRQQSQPRDPGAPRTWNRHYSARQVMWMLVRESATLRLDEQTYRERLLAHCPTIANGEALGHRFLRLVRERDSASLDAWLDDAETSGIKELKQFALGLRRDGAAVRNALHEPWSNGPVEAQVQQLKLIKRSMKGRANFDLLRKRVLLQI